jgi:hypothetical protein
MQKDKSHMSSLMWNINIIQIQQYYEKQIKLREVAYARESVKEGS